MKKITIGITDCSRYDSYYHWIAGQPGVSAIKLSHHADNLGDISRCHGVLLTGGEDVHPRFYNKPELLGRCEEVDEKRDEFEWRVLDYTEQHQVPLLGICRGLQMANVYYGGTLLPHIPDYGKSDHAKVGEADRYHAVHVEGNSYFRKIVETSSGEINSAHHQGADRIGDGLVASAHSPDGVVEGIERQDYGTRAFLLLVQWHPERMKDLENVFSKNVRRSFLEAVRNA